MQHNDLVGGKKLFSIKSKNAITRLMLVIAFLIYIFICSKITVFAYNIGNTGKTDDNYNRTVKIDLGGGSASMEWVYMLDSNGKFYYDNIPLLPAKKL